MSDSGVDYHMQNPPGCSDETAQDITFPPAYWVYQAATHRLIEVHNTVTAELVGKATRASVLSDWFVGTKGTDGQFYLIGTIMYDRVPEEKQVEMVVAMIKARLD